MTDTQDAEQMARIASHLTSRMGNEQGLTAAVNTLGIMVRTLGDMGQIERVEATAAGAYMQAVFVAEKAGGRRLTNEAKRNRLAGAVELLRDAADQLEKVVL